MKKVLVLPLVLICANVLAQTANDIVAAVKASQKKLQWASYTLARRDTLLTGEVRTMTGKVIVKGEEADKVFGFLFKSRMDGIKDELIYEGHVGYSINPVTKTYLIITNPSNIKNMLNGGAGWLVMPDLIKLDTSRIISSDLKDLGETYLLTLKYADYLPENVINRYKSVTINKATMLPLAVRNHSETNGRVQDLFWRIDQLQINNNVKKYDFALPFLRDYKQEITSPGTLPAVFSLKNSDAPNFVLNTFNGEKISLADFRGKVVLLDFWELWCGPCISGLPKVQSLFDRYKGRGLHILGIMNDVKQLAPAKKMLDQKNYSFPMVLGDEKLRKDYKLDGLVPLYLVINRVGKISFIGGIEGIEKEIIKALAE